MVRLNRSIWTVLAVSCLVGAGVVALLVAGREMPWEGRTSQADPARAESAPLLGQAVAGESAHARPEDPKFARMRARMVEEDLRGPGREIKDAKVLEVMGRIPRQEFVPEGLRNRAYADHPLPIGHDQTISQPYIVALMTQLVEPGAESRALDVGTGSGYQAAVLAEISKEVYSIEIVKPLAEDAEKRLKDLGYKNITVRHGDGYRGWEEKAPFDVIIVAAAPDHVPQPLVDQLAPGGKMVIPVGRYYQQLLVIERDKEGNVHRRPNIPVMFVPMTGEAQRRRE
ncbi:MAG TPA: protein-L-isoaspartate(D-aspartate) O-methyltransferase [Thermoguttaceae bacterium]|nr:protein-L-isoaspartate(D-aspartate) O-methyltransferase [Thermoguttaceae bacterium]